MSNVRLNIGGRHFTVACAAGEEKHIALLGREIDDKLRAMGGASGNSESRMLLFASLLLADELHEIRSRNDAAAAAVDHSPTLTRLVEGMEAAAERLEKLAQSLEQAHARA
jgi:cell division protein ZapA